MCFKNCWLWHKVAQGFFFFILSSMNWTPCKWCNMQYSTISQCGKNQNKNGTLNTAVLVRAVKLSNVQRGENWVDDRQFACMRRRAKVICKIILNLFLSFYLKKMHSRYSVSLELRMNNWISTFLHYFFFFIILFLWILILRFRY